MNDYLQWTGFRYDDDEFQNVCNQTYQNYNKIKSTNSLIQFDCIFIVKCCKNLIQKRDCEVTVYRSFNDQKLKYIENPYISYIADVRVFDIFTFSII